MNQRDLYYRFLLIPKLTILRRSVFFVVCIFSAVTQAQTDCALQARTELEILFCKIQNTGEGRTLPSYSDFQKNSPKIQAALLKAPARRLNLPLPKIADTAQRPKNKKLPNKQPSIKSSAFAQKKSNPRYSERRDNQQSESGNSLEECKLRSEVIECGHHSYRLATNLTNSYLRVGALGSTNKMKMQRFSGNNNDAVVIKNYLFDAYLLYIEKMLDIGLGASTMSFSKFYYTFYELQVKKKNFSKRFEEMYEFLKKDKASMAIKSSYTDVKPASISQCASLNQRIVVCDQKEMNWVFVKE